MKSNITLLQDNQSMVELKLRQMKELAQQIKELTAEYDQLKDIVIENYFLHASEYKTDKGLVLATRISYQENRFNSKRFETDFPDIYQEYKEEKTIFKFSLK